ncbi:MAG: zinc ABC transporter substrate-binding protein [Bacilli bacterium]|nr:zinc ABC transporter substrate-binding protein [Bacilli bacterium]
MKRLLRLFIVTSFLFILSGCFKTEELDNADIYTTTYPIEYLVSELYGYNSKVKSIYPNGVDINEYTLSNNKIKKYSKGDLFVYNGLTDEKKIAASFVNRNSRLKIIDVSEGLAIKNSYHELWLNPTNYLMLAQNVKNGLKQYIESKITKETIDENYNSLKVQLSEFETTLKTLGNNGTYTTIIVSKDYFKFLENYGFEVISLEETDELNNDTINRAKNLIKEKNNKFIYVTDLEANNENYNDAINEVKKAGAEIKSLHTLTVLTSEEREKNENYATLMRDNIELLKEEIYKEK